MILGFGEMLKEDRPPEDIWMDDEALVAHFKAREEARGSKDDKDEDDWGPEGSIIENQAADELLRNIGVRR